MHDVFRPSNLNQLPYRIREQARAVSGGSLPALTRVYALRQSLSEEQQLLLAPMYYAILDLSHLDSISTLDWDSDSEVVHRRISAVLSAMDSLINLIEFRIPPRAMDDAWVRIWAWIQFVDSFSEHLSVPLLQFQSAAKHYAEINASNLSGISPHHLVFSEVIHAYRNEYKLAASDFFRSHPRLFAILGRAWNAMVSPSRQDFLLWEITMSHGIYAASWCLLRYGHELLRCDGPHMEQLLDGVGGTWEHLASLLTRHLQHSTHDPDGPPTEVDLERVYATLEFLRGVTDGNRDPRPELRAALIQQAIVAALTGLSLRLVSARHVGEAVHIQTPVDTFRVLKALVLSDGRSELRIVEALRAGVPVITCEHCVYLSVLRALREAFKELAAFEELGELNPGEHFKMVGLGQEWVDCERLVRERLAVVDIYDTGSLTSLRTCDNTECGLVVAKRGLKRCAGCHDAWYCSSECQRSDWQHGHRKDCKIMGDSFIVDCRSRTQLAPQAGRSLLLRALLNFDYAVHEEEIIPHVVLHINSAPLVAKIDYPVGRLQFKISPAGKAIGSVGVLVRRAEMARERAQLTVMSYVQGSVVHSRGFLLRFSGPELYVGLRAYAATCERRGEPEQIIEDTRRIKELVSLAGIRTH
ncbi:hypothetical protein C8F01DRAFT_1230190 [Mycena amicta]|nr:hypothetical protein C8F01DRAFT_1230190 [Mycena amicta]